MSYARKGAESDVYVYSNGARFVCQDCALTGRSRHEEPSSSAMLSHLREHLRRGHKVPASTLERLANEDDAKALAFKGVNSPGDPVIVIMPKGPKHGN